MNSKKQKREKKINLKLIKSKLQVVKIVVVFKMMSNINLKMIEMSIYQTIHQIKWMIEL